MQFKRTRPLERLSDRDITNIFQPELRRYIDEIDYIWTFDSEFLDLTRKDCTNLNFSHKNIMGVNFSHSDMRKSNMNYCKFTTVNLLNCNLLGSTFGPSNIMKIPSPSRLIPISPDRQIIGIINASNELALLEYNTGKEIKTFKVDFSKILKVLISPCNTQLLLQYKSIIEFYDMHTCQLIHTFRGFSEIQNLVFSLSGKYLAIGSSNKQVQLWKMKKGAHISLEHKKKTKASAIGISCRGTMLAVQDESNDIILWNRKTEPQFKNLQEQTPDVLCFAFSPDDLFLASGDKEGAITVWNLATETTISLLDQAQTFQTHPNLVEFSRDGQYILSSGSDNIIRLFNHKDGTLDQSIHVDGVCVSSANTPYNTFSIFTKTRDILKEYIIDLTDSKKICDGNILRLIVLTISQDGKLIATGNGKGTIKLWDLNTGNCLKTLSENFFGIETLAISPDSKLLVSGSPNRCIEVWDIERETIVMELKIHQDKIGSVAFSPDGELVASGSYDKSIKIWQIHNGEEVMICQGHNHIIRSVVFSPNGMLIASGSADKSVKIWDANSGKCDFTFLGHTSEVTSVNFSSHGTLLVSGSCDKTIKIWDLQSKLLNKDIYTYGRVNCVSFSPDVRLLVSAGSDGAICVWSVRNGENYFTLFNAHNCFTVTAAFSPDGNFIVSGNNGRLRMWEIFQEKCNLSEYKRHRLKPTYLQRVIDNQFTTL